MEIGYTVRIFRERETFVAHTPELDISSCGDTEAEARSGIAEAVQLFVETAREEGTLERILEEAGYTFENGRWREPQFVAADRFLAKVV